MKKFMVLLLSIASLVMASETYSSIIPVNQLVDTQFFQKIATLPQEDMIDYFLENWDPQTVILFPQGTLLPINILLNSEFFSFQCEDIPTIILEKDLYIQFRDNNLFISDDTKRWKKAHKFFTGNITCEMLEKAQEFPTVFFQAEIHKR